MQEQKADKLVSVKFEPKHYRQLKKMAKENAVPVSTFIRMAVKEYMKNPEKYAI